ncbi:hypothetical protein HMI56_003454 [Coelomomyces lativittatus]|nr:hypothetical protein HMI56_003454 [Coelomomyces lativittatus]
MEVWCLFSVFKFSALNDPRFPPIHDGELPHLTCSVSLLVQFENIEDSMDWEIGTHGLRIRFDDPFGTTKSYSSTFLPEVALEQGWDKETTFRALIKKSGYQGAVTNSVLESIQVVRYQSSKAAADYETFSSWKKSLQF